MPVLEYVYLEILPMSTSVTVCFSSRADIAHLLILADYPYHVLIVQANYVDFGSNPDI